MPQKVLVLLRLPVLSFGRRLAKPKWARGFGQNSFRSRSNIGSGSIDPDFGAEKFCTHPAKSASFIYPLAANNIFSGLTSLCIISILCK